MKMIKSMLLGVALLATTSSLFAQTLVISDFTSGGAASAGVAPWVGFDNGFGMTGAGIVTNKGAGTSHQFIDDVNGSTLDFSSYDGLSLTVDITALTETFNPSLVLEFYDADFVTVIQSFTWDLSDNLAAGFVTLTGQLSGDYSAISFINVTTNLNLAAGESFSAQFTNLSLTTIPEPSTYALLALGAGALFVLRRKQLAKQA